MAGPPGRVAGKLSTPSRAATGRTVCTCLTTRLLRPGPRVVRDSSGSRRPSRRLLPAAESGSEILSRTSRADQYRRGARRHTALLRRDAPAVRRRHVSVDNPAAPISARGRVRRRASFLHKPPPREGSRPLSRTGSLRRCPRLPVFICRFLPAVVFCRIVLFFVAARYKMKKINRKRKGKRFGA
jgi:hypothetical protein